MDIRIITDAITRAQALEIGKEFYGDMVKGVADIEKGIIALGGEYHMDAANILVEHGSEGKDLWGFNVYPNVTDTNWIEYTSLINIRPDKNNRGMLIESQEIRDRVRGIIEKLII